MSIEPTHLHALSLERITNTDRLKSLHDTGLLDTAPEIEFDRIARLAGTLLEATLACVSLVDSDRQFLKSCMGVIPPGITSREMPISESFCKYVVAESCPLVVSDARNHPVLGRMDAMMRSYIVAYLGVPLILSNGHVLGALCVIDNQPRDWQPRQVEILTELAALVITEIELRAARDAADAANRAKSQFLAHMSHEIRTPMTSILGYVDMLRDRTKLPEQHDEWIHTIQRNGQHLLGIINDLLDLSKIEAGAMTLETLPTDIAPLVNGVMEMMRIRVAQRPISLNVRLLTPLPERIETDPTRLRQILINLIGNAVKFTKQGNVTVLISAIATPESDVLKIIIRDTGRGIANEHLDLLFDPFTQSDRAHMRTFGGTGLGLSISRRLARMLGGDISVFSEEHVGSAFTFTMPVKPTESARLITTLESPRPPQHRCYDLSPVRLSGHVLVVDDSQDVRMLVQMYLKHAGLTFEAAENGQDGVDRVARSLAGEGKPFDLVIMDLQMPIMDGHTAVPLIRDAGFDRPIIALTANAMAHDRERCLNSGFDHFMSKPVDITEFVSVLRKYLPATLVEEPKPTNAITAAA